MGQPRPGRKRAVVVSSSDEDDEVHINDDGGMDGKSEDAKEKPLRATRSTTRSQVALDQASRRGLKGQAKSKASAEPPKRGNKSIFSFFNAATQKQQDASSQLTASPPQRSGTPVTHIEDIQDDISGDDTSIPISSGSQTTQSLRKRKLNRDQIGGLNDGPSRPTQKFRKISDGSKLSAKVNSEDSRPWSERFAPANLSELAVHKKKVLDVRSVLESALSDRARPRVIVLKGAAGTAKTTTLNLLAKDMGLKVIEWKNSVGADPSAASVSASSQFEEFVLRSGTFGGLDLIRGDDVVLKDETTSDPRQIMLVEEFPSTFAKSSPVLQAFRNTVMQFLATTASPFSRPTPLVLIVSEALLSTSTASADSFTAHRLLGPQILNHPQTALIDFNNIAPTILIKALETIVIKESRRSGRRTTPGPGVLKQLAETGDIRSAVSSLEFLCLCGDKDNPWSAKVTFTKPKGRQAEAPLTKQEEEILKLVSNRESSLGIFHAVGRVVHNKRVDPSLPTPQPPPYFPQHRKPRVPEKDPETLIDEIGTDTSTFISALHENYALSCCSTSSEDAMDSLNGCIDSLSDSDILSLDRLNFGNRAYSGSAQDNLRQDDMSFQIAVRGLLFWLPSPVNRTAGLPRAAKRGDEFRMFYPSSLKLWKLKEELEGTLESVVSLLQNQVAGSDATSSSSREGVESWGRHRSAHAQDEAIDPLSITLLSSAARSEFLLDRLPYASQILSRRKNLPASLISGIESITHMTGDAIRPSDQEQEIAEDNEETSSEWTDKPDMEGGRKQKGNGQEFEGQGLQIPVEHAVERLVLSDDDIVDD